MYQDKLLTSLLYNPDSKEWTMETNEPERFVECSKCKKRFSELGSKKMFCPAFKVCFCEECDPQHLMMGETEHEHFNISWVKEQARAKEEVSK